MNAYLVEWRRAPGTGERVTLVLGNDPEDGMRAFRARFAEVFVVEAIKRVECDEVVTEAR